MNGADSYFWTEDPLPPDPERIPLMLFIGVDPGVSGGIAIIDSSGRVVLATKMPETDRDIFNTFTIDSVRYKARAVLEKVNPGVFGRPGAKMGVVSAFTFGGNYRALKMALTAADVPFDEALPVKWQTFLGCRSGGDKNITKARAQQLFPHVKVTHAIADALLLAEYCRRTERGSLNRGPATGAIDGEEEIRYQHPARQIIEETRCEEAAAEAVTQGRRARAPRWANPEARQATAVAGRRRRSRQQGDRQRGV